MPSVTILGDDIEIGCLRHCSTMGAGLLSIPVGIESCSHKQRGLCCMVVSIGSYVKEYSICYEFSLEVRQNKLEELRTLSYTIILYAPVSVLK